MPVHLRSCRLHRHVLVATVTASALLMTAGCGGGSDQASSNDRTLALSVLGAPNSFAVADLADGQQAYVWNSVYDTLLYLDNKGRIQPNAAESWSYAEGGRTLTLKLHKGMSFSNGNAVNAAGVKASLDHVRTSPGTQQAFLGSIASIEAPDDLTVVLTLKTPDAALLTSLTMGAGAIADPATMKDPGAALNPVGSGPYVVDKGATVNGSIYVLKKRDGYWNSAAYPFETVKVKVIADRTASVNALQAGELNAGSVETSQVAQVKSAGFDVTLVPATSVGNLVMADRDGKMLKPLADVRVRQAINMAFDRQKIATQFLRGAGKATEQIANPQSPAHDPALDTTYPYDPTAAKRLMTEAGYPNGFSVKMPSLFFTKPFEPTVGQALKDIGIDVTWEPVPPQNSNLALSSGQYAMFFIADGLNSIPRDAANYFSPAGSRNPFHTTNAEISGLMEQASVEQDPAKASDAFKKINTFGVKNAWYAPLFYVGTSWVTKKGITYLGDGSSALCTVRAFGTSD